MDAYLTFLALAVAGLLVPGPDTFVVLRTSVAAGARAGMWAAAGSAAGNLVWGTASAVGVTSLLAASDTAFTALKLAGAAYLVVLGLQALLAAKRGDSVAPPPGSDGALAARTAFRRGLASDLLNVKVGLFWTALLPQVVGPESGSLLPVAMTFTFAAMVFGWLTGYAHLAARLSELLRGRRSSRVLNGSVGVMLVTLGAGLG
ncbi:MAG: LysE family translocator [Actinomycetota bacterium]|nr:LysE family translocator [Actinomycetota bacterium]